MSNLVKVRQSLLPWWMKFFIWIFMIVGIFSAVSIAFKMVGITLYFGYPMDDTSSIYGLESSDIFSPLGLLINLLILFKGVTSYGMWMGKDWAMNYASVDAVLGLVVCIFSLVFLPFVDAGSINLRLEILLLIPYLIKCLKLRAEWKYLSIDNLPTLGDLNPKLAFAHNASTSSNPRVMKAAETERGQTNTIQIDKEDHSRFMPNP